MFNFRCRERRRQSSESSATPESQRRSSIDSVGSHSSVPNTDWLRAVENRLKYDSTLSSPDNSITTTENNVYGNVMFEETFKEINLDSKSNCDTNMDSCDSVPNIVIESSRPTLEDNIDIGRSKDLDKSDNVESFEVQNTKDKTVIIENLERRVSEGEKNDATPVWMISPELLALRHNLTFPESTTASPIIRRTHRVCRKFSVDLSKKSYLLSIFLV